MTYRRSRSGYLPQINSFDITDYRRAFPAQLKKLITKGFISIKLLYLPDWGEHGGEREECRHWNTDSGFNVFGRNQEAKPTDNDEEDAGQVCLDQVVAQLTTSKDCEHQRIVGLV